MTLNRMILAGALTAAVGLAGCTSTRQALGMTKVTPDEFRVVTKAPLVVPPDYALRPPAPGEPRPQELQPESAARAALLGEREDAGRSQGEQLLVAKAGVDRADPLIRYVVDDEFGETDVDVSPTRTSSSGQRSPSATACATFVWMPWPISHPPCCTWTEPSAPKMRTLDEMS